jgi:hypothetical protein
MEQMMPLMKRSVSVLCLGLMMLLPPVAAAQGNTWVLDQVVDIDGRARAQAATGKAWEYGVEHVRDDVRGSASLRTRYTGPTDNSFKVPHVHGSEVVVLATWTPPPARIAADAAVTLRLTGKVERAPQWPQASLMQTAQVVTANRTGAWTMELRRFRPKDRAQTQVIGAGNRFAPYDSYVTATMPRGSKVTDRVAIRISNSSGNASSEAIYIYRWTAD